MPEDMGWRTADNSILYTFDAFFWRAPGYWHAMAAFR
jgi:hypothetical protein